MLVLTRKIGEAISIGDDIKIIVMQVKGKQVRLGIKAGPNTMVHREEVYQRIQDENQSASQSSTDDLLAGSRVAESAGLTGLGSQLSKPILNKRIRASSHDPDENVELLGF